jgi:hypothetical protein
MKPLSSVIAVVTMIALLVLAGCKSSATADGIDALAADPVRLKTVRQQCQADRAKAEGAVCQAAAEAFRRRFFAGIAGPDEYRTLADLPPIPPSFDEPMEVAP